MHRSNRSRGGKLPALTLNNVPSKGGILIVNPSFYNEEWRTARCEHTCCECGNTIAVGSRYRYNCGVWLGDFDNFYQCHSCALAFDLVTAYFHRTTGDVVPFGGLHEAVEEMVADIGLIAAEGDD